MVFKILSGFTLAIVFGAVSWILYSQLGHFEVLTHVRPGPWEVTTKEVHPGDPVDTRLVFCKDLAASGEVTVFIHSGGILYRTPSYVINTPVGCYDRVMSLVKVPSKIPLSARKGELGDGTAKAYIQIVYTINKLRTVTYKYETQEFTILAK